MKFTEKDIFKKIKNHIFNEIDEEQLDFLQVFYLPEIQTKNVEEYLFNYLYDNLSSEDVIDFCSEHLLLNLYIEEGMYVEK